MSEVMHGDCYVSRASISERIYRWLGFGRAHADRPGDDETGEFAPGWLCTDTFVHFDWRDRLRVLISGRAMVQSVMQTDVLVGKARTISKTSILPPGVAQ